MHPTDAYKGLKCIRRMHLVYVILSCSTVPLQRTAALPLESGYQPPIYPLPFLCLRFVKTSWLSKVGPPTFTPSLLLTPLIFFSKMTVLGFGLVLVLVFGLVLVFVLVFCVSVLC